MMVLHISATGFEGHQRTAIEPTKRGFEQCACEQPLLPGRSLRLRGLSGLIRKAPMAPAALHSGVAPPFANAAGRSGCVSSMIAHDSTAGSLPGAAADSLGRQMAQASIIATRHCPREEGEVALSQRTRKPIEWEPAHVKINRALTNAKQAAQFIDRLCEGRRRAVANQRKRTGKRSRSRRRKC
jgi:hypothetical protein